MTVVVNAVAAKMGGAATYIRQLVAELARTPGAGRFIFYVPPEQTDLGGSLPSHIEWRVTRIGHAGALRRLWWDQVTLRRIMRREKVAVLYSTANFAMLYCPVPQILLVRNALYVSALYRKRFLLRQSPWRRFEFALRRWWLRVSTHQADQLLVPSKTMAEELSAAWPKLAARVRVNCYGVTNRETQARARRPGAPFKLAYASLYAEHKNLGTVLRALRELAESGEADFQFCTTADPTWPPARTTTTWQEDLRLAQEEPLRGRVRFVSPERPDALRQLYEDCSLVIYPTLVESFGHPLLEALHAGLPVLAADTPINRELAGEAAVYFEGLNPADLAAKIRTLWRDPGRRAAMAEQGRARVAGFGWDLHVARLLAAVAEAAGLQRL